MSVVADFADALLQHFPPFQRWEDYQEKAWADTLVQELSGFDAEVIRRAQRQMIRSRKPRDPKPPMVSECVAACDEAKRWIDAERNKARGPMLDAASPAVGEWSAERLSLAYDLIRTGQGRQAAREGWILALWHFARKNGRVPAGPEIDRCKRESANIEQICAECSSKSDPYSQALAKWGFNILSKRAELAAIAGKPDISAAVSTAGVTSTPREGRGA